MTDTNEGAAVTERQREQYRQDRERRDEWDKQPFPKSREREREANEQAYWRAVAEIPNPGPVEPLTELQAFHAEQTDPPPGPYPDPPLGPYPDPVIKERPSEEAVYGDAPGPRTRTAGARSAREGRSEGGEGRSARSERQGAKDRPGAARGTGISGAAGTGRAYDEPNVDGYDEDIRERAEGAPSAAAPERQQADVRKPPNARSSNVSKPAESGNDKRRADREAEREAGPEERGHAGRSEADRSADRPGER